MHGKRILALCFVLAGMSVTLSHSGYSQDSSIDARISGGRGEGKCTFEVTVRGSAEVQIRGPQGRLVTLSGTPAQWRRLDCNQPLPANPIDFKFNGVDGHGKQSLAADPGSNHGVAVIRIENNRNSSEGYTGDITWRSGGRTDNWGRDSDDRQ